MRHGKVLVTDGFGNWEEMSEKLGDYYFEGNLKKHVCNFLRL